MKLTIPQQSLERVVSAVKGAAGTLPMLACILLRAEGETLRATATDLTTTVMTGADARVAESGEVAVRAADLAKIVGVCPPGDVVLEAGTGRLDIRAGGSKWAIMAQPGRDYPRLPEVPVLTDVDAAVLSDAIGRTLYSVSNDQTRPHLSGVYLEADGETLCATSTDGHRLSHVKRPFAGFPKLARGVVVPRKGLIEVAELIDGAERCGLAIGGELVCQAGATTVVVKLNDSQFPPYEQVIPTHTHGLTVDRAGLLETVERVAVVASQKTNGAAFVFGPTSLRIDVTDPEMGEASATVTGEGNGAEKTVGISTRYVADMLRAMDCERVFIGYADELDPVLVTEAGTNSDDCAVVMPMRL